MVRSIYGINGEQSNIGSNGSGYRSKYANDIYIAGSGDGQGGGSSGIGNLDPSGGIGKLGDGKLKAKAKAAIEKAKEAVQKLTPSAKKIFPLFIAMRAAFLSLIALNFRSFATRIAVVIQKNPSRVKQLWEAFGGDYNHLVGEVVKNKGKKGLFPMRKAPANYKYPTTSTVETTPAAPTTYGSPSGAAPMQGIGVVTVAAIGALLAAATPIVIAVVNMLKENGEGADGDDEDLADGANEWIDENNDGYDDKTGLDADGKRKPGTPSGGGGGGEASGGIPSWVIPAALAALFII